MSETPEARVLRYTLLLLAINEPADQSVRVDRFIQVVDALVKHELDKVKPREGTLPPLDWES